MGQNELKGRHTPGPWTFSASDKLNPDRAFGIVRALGKEFDEEAGTDGATEVVAEVCASEGDTTRSDAALIAAAPDLLSACIGAAQVLKHFPADSLEGGRYRACMDAIARAENGGAA